MPSKVIPIFVIPVKPALRISYLRSKYEQPDLWALNLYAAELCREAFSRLATLDPSRIRRISYPREGELP